MPQIITTGHVLEGTAELDEEADSIGQTAASHAEQMLPWLEVVSCEVTLEVLIWMRAYWKKKTTDGGRKKRNQQNKGLCRCALWKKQAMP